MPDNIANIILNMTIDGALRSVDQVKKKLKEVGEEGGKAGEHMLVHFGKSLLTAHALIGVVKGIAEAFNTAAANAAKLSKETGGDKLRA